MSAALKRLLLLSVAAWGCMLPLQLQGAPVIPKEHIRTEDQTFLTYPEWFLVFSPAEYATHLQSGRPSDFPFMGHVGQFWQSYRAMVDQTVERSYKFNGGYHLMVMVIGVSTTVEYALRSAYENTLGRVSEGTSFKATAEDALAASYAQDYVDFIRDLPWYRYDFLRQLKALWSDVPWFGNQPVRKLERRFLLTSELIVKAAYGKLLGLASGAVYDEARLDTAVIVTHPGALTKAMTAKFEHIKVLDAADGSRALITVPRYERFAAYATQLAVSGVDFENIAGNRSIILVSLLGPSAWRPVHTDAILFEQPILTQHGTKRVVATVKVERLADALRAWSGQASVEHVFDY